MGVGSASAEPVFLSDVFAGRLSAVSRAVPENRSLWAPQDFGKPGLDKYPAESRTWQPVRSGSLCREGRAGASNCRADCSCRRPAENALTAWPGRLTMEVWLPDDDPSVHLQLPMVRQSRQPPAGSDVAVVPARRPGTERLAAGQIGPGGRPAGCGEQWGRERCTPSRRAFLTRTTKADCRWTRWTPRLSRRVAAPCWTLTISLPDMSGGIHVNLFNNTWGTNYVMWLDDDVRFRFVLRV